jgi:hypothetical protein
VTRQTTTRWLLTAGVFGPIFFVVVFLVEGWTRANYDPQRQFVSLLSLTDDGWQQIGNFVITGVLFALAAVGWRGAMPDGPGCRWVPVLLGLSGIGLVVAGIFLTDPGYGYPPGTPPGMPTQTSWHGVIHQLASVLVFFGLPIATFVMARRFRAEGGRWAPFQADGRRWSLYSAVSGVAMLAIFVGAFALPDLSGLLQRVTIVIGFGWVAQVSSRFRAAEVA